MPWRETYGLALDQNISVEDGNLPPEGYQCQCDSENCSYELLRFLAELLPDRCGYLFPNSIQCPFCPKPYMESCGALWCIKYLKQHVCSHDTEGGLYMKHNLTCGYCFQEVSKDLSLFCHHLDICFTWNLIRWTRLGIRTIEPNQPTLWNCSFCTDRFDVSHSGEWKLIRHVHKNHTAGFQLGPWSIYPKNPPCSLSERRGGQTGTSMEYSSSKFSFGSYLHSMTTNGSCKSLSRPNGSVIRAYEQQES